MLLHRRYALALLVAIIFNIAISAAIIFNFAVVVAMMSIVAISLL